MGGKISRRIEATLGYSNCIRMLRTGGANYFISKALEGVYIGVSAATGSAKFFAPNLTGRDILSTDYTVIENVFPLANTRAGDVSAAVKSGLVDRFPTVPMNEIAPAIPWKITNKALRELGLKLHDEQTTEHLKEMMAETRQRERQPSQSAIMAIPDKDEPPAPLPRKKFDIQERAMYMLHDSRAFPKDAKSENGSKYFDGIHDFSPRFIQRDHGDGRRGG